MSEREKLLAIAVFIILGDGLLIFYSIRDGIIRRSAKVNAFRQPITGERAVWFGVAWLIVAAVFLATGVWLARYALGLPPT